MGSDVEPNRKHFLAEQLREEWNDDRRFFSDVSRIEQELKSLQDIAPIPTNTINADFDRDVNTIETTIREIEKQFPR